MAKCHNCDGLGEIVTKWRCLQCDEWNSYNPDGNNNITCQNCGKYFNLYNSMWKARITRHGVTCNSCGGTGYIYETNSRKKSGSPNNLAKRRLKRFFLWLVFTFIAVLIGANSNTDFGVVLFLICSIITVIYLLGTIAAYIKGS